MVCTERSAEVTIKISRRRYIPWRWWRWTDGDGRAGVVRWWTVTVYCGIARTLHHYGTTVPILPPPHSRHACSCAVMPPTPLSSRIAGYLRGWGERYWNERPSISVAAVRPDLYRPRAVWIIRLLLNRQSDATVVSRHVTRSSVAQCEVARSDGLRTAAAAAADGTSSRRTTTRAFQRGRCTTLGRLRIKKKKITSRHNDNSDASSRRRTTQGMTRRGAIWIVTQEARSPNNPRAATAIPRRL